MADMEWDGDAFLRDLTDGLERGVTAAAIELEGEIKERLRVPPERSGELYPVLKGDGTPGSRVHRASAPGESPATLKGNLATSITHRVERQSDTIRGEVGPVADGPHSAYAARLEYGGEHTTTKDAYPRDAEGKSFRVPAGTKIVTKPRPYVRPAWEESKEGLGGTVMDETEAHLRERGWLE